MQVKTMYKNNDNSIYDNIKSVEVIVCQGSGEEFYQGWSNNDNLIFEVRKELVKEIILS